MVKVAQRESASSPLGAGGHGRQTAPYAVRLEDRELVITEGHTTIGRSPDAGIVLDSPLVSRQHARFVASLGSVTIEDLGSRNGVLVNGALISGGVSVYPGDRIQLGDQVLEIVARALESVEPETGEHPRASRTLIDLQQSDADRDEERTRSADTLTLLTAVVDKALALGRGDEAERLLAVHLRRVLRDAENLEPMPSKIPELAVTYALKLANVTRKASWIDYAIRVYAGLNRPLPMEAINQLYTLLRKVRGVDVPLLRGYVALLRARAAELGPAERFAIKRIEGLTTLTGV